MERRDAARNPGLAPDQGRRLRAEASDKGVCITPFGGRRPGFRDASRRSMRATGSTRCRAGNPALRRRVGVGSRNLPGPHGLIAMGGSAA